MATDRYRLSCWAELAAARAALERHRAAELTEHSEEVLALCEEQYRHSTRLVREARALCAARVVSGAP